MKLQPLKCMEVFGKGPFIPAGTRAVQGPRHPAAPAHAVTRMRETVSLDSVEMSKYPVVCGLVKKGEERRRRNDGGGRGKRSSSIKSPYVHSTSSTVGLGVRARQAEVWASRTQPRALARGRAASGLPLPGLPLFQGPFLLDTSADLLLKPAHLLLKLTDEIYHTLRAGVGRGEKMKGSRLDGLMRRGEKKVRSQQQVMMMKRKERKHGPGNQVSR